MGFLDLVSVAAGAALAFYGAVGACALALRDGALIERVWGLGFAFVATALVGWSDATPARGLFAWSFAVLWGVRASSHAFWRVRRAPSLPPLEGFWEVLLASWFPRAVGTAVGSLPLVGAIGVGEPGELGGWEYLGCATFLVGFALEVRADYELGRFLHDHAQGVWRRGLHALSRKPAAFGACLVWWGLWLLGAHTDAGLLGLVGVAMHTVALARPQLERDRARAERSPAYARYLATTSAFLPWPASRAPRSGP